MAHNRRVERVAAQVTVRLPDGSTGITRDLSPSGVYLVADEGAHIGETLRFSIEFPNLGAPLFLEGEGEIVRTEEGVQGRRGLAIRILESHLERRGTHRQRRAGVRPR